MRIHLLHKMAFFTLSVLLLLPGLAVAAELVLDIDGTESNATITASVTGAASFQSAPHGSLTFLLPPNDSGIDVSVEGPLGNINPWHLRGPADGSYLNLLRISSGDASTFTLDQNNPITSSSNFVSGDVTQLAVFDGVTSFMQCYDGTGPDIDVTVNYNIQPEPDLIIDVNGTESNATITASVTGAASFESTNYGSLTFWLPPNNIGVNVSVEGPLGDITPWLLRGPADGSYLNLLLISSGDASTFTLDQNNPITSSSNFVSGDVTQLAVFDGVTSFMQCGEGTGPDIDVTVNYNIQPEPDLIIDVNGTESNATITASVTGAASFQSTSWGSLIFLLPPNDSGINVFVEGPLGDINPWQLRGPADGSYLNLLAISSGDASTFTLDQNNPITSSSNFVSGDVTQLAVFDGVTSFMQCYDGTGPDIDVTVNYNIDPLADAPAGDRPPPADRIRGAFPNPFNPSTTIDYVLSEPGRATLKAYGMDGRLVRSLVDAVLEAGPQVQAWNGLDDAGRPLPSGSYLLLLKTPGGASSWKVTLAK